jgi:hypothetical protein
MSSRPAHNVARQSVLASTLVQTRPVLFCWVVVLVLLYCNTVDAMSGVTGVHTVYRMMSARQYPGTDPSCPFLLGGCFSGCHWCTVYRMMIVC